MLRSEKLLLAGESNVAVVVSVQSIEFPPHIVMDEGRYKGNGEEKIILQCLHFLFASNTLCPLGKWLWRSW